MNSSKTPPFDNYGTLSETLTDVSAVSEGWMAQRHSISLPLDCGHKKVFNAQRRGQAMELRLLIMLHFGELSVNKNIYCNRTR